MKVAIDISQTAHLGTGVARYTHALIESLVTYAPEHTYTFFFSSLRKDPPQEIIDLIQPPHRLVQHHIPPTFLSFLWNTLHVVPIETFVGDVDVYISSDWTQAPTKKAKKVTIIHDLVVFLFPETSTTKTTIGISTLNIRPNIVATHKKRLQRVQRECDHVIADSKSTQKDIQKILSISGSKVTVLYPPVHTSEPSEDTILRTRSMHNLKRPFILSVGTIEPRKNIERLIRAFSKAELYKTHDLVVVGAKGWGDTSHSGLSKEAEEAVKFLGYIPDSDLYALYSSADLFVMPSLYEGFGYPLIEAMSLGCPIAASNTSSVGELATGFGPTFNPENLDEISHVLKRALEPTKQRESNVLRAKKFAQSFSHEEYAKNLSTILERLYNE